MGRNLGALPGLVAAAWLCTGCAVVPDASLAADFGREETEVVRPAAGRFDMAPGEVSRMVDRAQVADLPFNGRSSLQLVTLVPGAPQPTTDALELLTSLAIDTSINGSRTNANLLTVDGGFNMDSGSNNSQISNVGADFIAQVSVKTSIFPAEYGRNSGAAINVVTRSGTNTFKGSAFEYVRRHEFDANDYFNNLEGVQRPSLTYDNFGGSLGGPILKNRAFFFGGVEWRRIRRLTSPTFRTIPNSAMRAGDFSALSTTLRNPDTGVSFPGNIIPANVISADGRAIASVFAAMAKEAVWYDDAKIANNALYQQSSPFDFRQEMLRVDIRPSRVHRLGARLVFDQSSAIAPFGTSINSKLPTIPTERRRPSLNVQAHHNWTAGSLANEATFNCSGNDQAIRPIGDGWKRETYGFAFPQLYSGGRHENSIPNVDVSGFASFRGANGALYAPTRDYSVSDTLTWVGGGHTVMAGGLFVYNQKDQNGRSDYAGTVTFSARGNTMTTGYGFADALLGNFRTYQEAQLDPIGDFRFHQYEAFASDAWRVNGRLSVEAGLRYAWQMPTIALGNNTTNFDPSRYRPSNAVVVNTNGTVVAGSGDRYNGLSRPGNVPPDQLAAVPGGDSALVKSIPVANSRGYYPNHNLWAPRLSFAWTPTDKGPTAVRGGVGLSYDRPEGNLYFPLANNPPFVSSSAFQDGNLATPGGGTVAAIGPWGAIQAIDPNLTIPRVWNWSVSVQRELPWHSLFGEVAYVGNRGVNLLRRPDINAPTFEDLTRNIALKYSTDYWRPYKGFSEIQMYLSDAASRYNALQFVLSRRRGDLNFTINYTISKAMDNASSNSDAVDPGTSALEYNWGPSNNDRRHIFVSTFTCRLPFFRNGSGWERAVLGGWEMSGIYRWQSGQPFTVTAGTGIGTRRADYLGGDPYMYSVNVATGVITWLDPTRFAVAPDSRPGNSRRNQFVGPPYRTLDVSIRKSFTVRGQARLQFQADVFNAFNEVNWNNPSANITGNTPFGTITSAAPPRNIQLGVRFTF